MALNRAGPNNGHFDAEVVKILRFQAGQSGHLRAALNLKNANRVGVSHHLKCFRVILRQIG